MKVKAKKINDPSCYYFTEGKVYEAIHDFGSEVFYVIDDEYDEMTCSFKGCPHIKGNWTIITDKAKVR